MDKHYFIELLNKHLRGEATQEENQFLIRYYNLFELEPDVEALLMEEKNKQIKNEIKENIWKNIEFKEQLPKKVIPLNNRIIRVAAAVIFVVICTTAVFFVNRTSSKEQSFVSLLNEQKGHRLILLPDGSSVIVNIGAKLKYPPSFTDLNKREVYLEGEAFFDIAHNPDKPFIVHTGK
ncbi:MAG: anti-FecI sigma factor FecR, partial [Segetibacter sp.]|nr:anti-FecI sigma factor FecR [Segetibacter sp.]